MSFVGCVLDHGKSMGLLQEDIINAINMKKKMENLQMESKVKLIKKNLYQKNIYFTLTDLIMQKRLKKKVRECKEKINNDVKDLFKFLQCSTSSLSFLSEAVEILIECKRVLKWTYVYGFYIKQSEKDLFEFNQADFELNCEHLLEMIEKKVTIFHQQNGMDEFNKFKESLINYAQCTKKFMNGLLEYIEMGKQ
eukprot:TRINITY_DN5817_c0_g1_i1.p2 TRINITY_DN5817_c0_g1~~TRINITY_DN5817_c0_g1_i1.p2  ORF type:complete len:194 (-),score=38.82 TRINITY_DN5817_c0_g1_i1:217-798(-)